MHESVFFQLFHSLGPGLIAGRKQLGLVGVVKLSLRGVTGERNL